MGEIERKREELLRQKYDSFSLDEKTGLYTLLKNKKTKDQIVQKIEKLIYIKKPPTVDEFLDPRNGWLRKDTVDSLYSEVVDDLYDIIENSAKYNIISFYGATRIGKSHKKDTPILMYDLSIKKIQDIKVGDLVKIIDEGGDDIGDLGDIGIVDRIELKYTAPLVVATLQTGRNKGEQSGRFYFRYELVEREWDE